MTMLSGLKWIDRNIEKIVVLICYVAMAGIIFVEVIRRFVFQSQAAWSTTIPIYLFLWVTWMGAAYNTRIRTHLRFDEVRARLPYNAQFACLCLDAAARTFERLGRWHRYLRGNLQGGPRDSERHARRKCRAAALVEVRLTNLD